MQPLSRILPVHQELRKALKERESWLHPFSCLHPTSPTLVACPALPWWGTAQKSLHPLSSVHLRKLHGHSLALYMTHEIFFFFHLLLTVIFITEIEKCYWGWVFLSDQFLCGYRHASTVQGCVRSPRLAWVPAEVQTDQHDSLQMSHFPPHHLALLCTAMAKPELEETTVYLKQATTEAKILHMNYLLSSTHYARLNAINSRK